MSKAKNTLASVTNFLYCGDEYLFVQRKPNASINPGEINGIGGKIETGEDYISAAIRETKEETGYIVNNSDINFCGIIKFEEGYKDVWITCFFKVKVPHKKIPVGQKTREGKLFWMKKDEVLGRDRNLVDDINYIFEDIVSEDKQFFMTVSVSDKTNKIIKSSTQKI